LLVPFNRRARNWRVGLTIVDAPEHGRTVHESRYRTCFEMDRPVILSPFGYRTLRDP
jgi:hypothetical protein